MIRDDRVIVSPIKISEISKAVGVVDKRLYKLCYKDGLINMWSRYKPVIINAPIVNRNSEWWKGDMGDCGIKAPNRVNTLAEVKAMYDGGLNGWSYDKPRWCRVLDFDV